MWEFVSVVYLNKKWNRMLYLDSYRKTHILIEKCPLICYNSLQVVKLLMIYKPACFPVKAKTVQ